MNSISSGERSMLVELEICSQSEVVSESLDELNSESIESTATEQNTIPLDLSVATSSFLILNPTTIFRGNVIDT